MHIKDAQVRTHTHTRICKHKFMSMQKYAKVNTIISFNKLCIISMRDMYVYVSVCAFDQKLIDPTGTEIRFVHVFMCICMHANVCE